MNRFQRTIVRLLACAAAGALLLACPLRADDLMPADLDARRAEFAALQTQIEAEEAVLGPLTNAVIERVPAFLRHHESVQAIELSREERRALAASGIDALPAEKARVWREAGPAFVDLKERMIAYFASYDRYQRAQLNRRCFGLVLSALERYENVLPHLSPRRRRKAEEKIAKVLEKEEAYRKILADPKAKNHHRSNGARFLYFAADGLDDHMLDLERACGLAPKKPWGARVGTALKNIKLAARVTKIWGATIPAAVRCLAYLYNPFRKSPDPDKTNELLQFFSKSYRWAAGWKLTVAGEDRIPQGKPVIFALSHRSHVDDTMAMFALIPKNFSFLVGSWAWPKFLNDKMLEDPTIINVGAKKPDGTTVNAIDEAVRNLENGINVALFPEGTVTTMQQETLPLHTGVDVIASAVADEAICIVPVMIDDPAAGYDDYLVHFARRKPEITVTFAAPIDALKFKAVPGADQRFLLNVIRGFWHRHLYRKDVSLEASTAKSIGTLTGATSEKFDALYPED